MVMMFVSSITPGPNNILLMTAGAHHGFRACWGHMLGISLGFGFQIFLLIVGLGIVINQIPQFQIALGWASGLYLLWMTWGLAKNAIRMPQHSAISTPLSETATTAKTLGKRHDPRIPMTFMQAAIFQWINPKAWTMAIAVPAGLMPKEWSPPLAISISIAVCILINLPCVAVWAGMGASLRRVLHRVWVARIFYTIMASAMLGTAVYMLPIG